MYVPCIHKCVETLCARNFLPIYDNDVGVGSVVEPRIQALLLKAAGPLLWSSRRMCQDQHTPGGLVLPQGRDMSDPILDSK